MRSLTLRGLGRQLGAGLAASLLVCAAASAQAQPAPAAAPAGSPSAASAAPAEPAAPEAAPAPPPAPVVGAELPIAVLTIQTEEAFPQAEALSNALKRVVEETPGWSSLPNDQALQVLVLSLECAEPPDAACEEKIAGELKVDRFIWGIMKKQGELVTTELHLWQRGQGRRSTELRYSTNLTEAADESLLVVARKAFTDLAGAPPGGRVTIKAGAVNGKLLVDGKEAGKLTNGVVTIELPIGPHDIRVEAMGYEPMEAKIEIEPRSTREISLVPVRESKGIDFQIVGGFGLVGLGAGLGVVGLLSSLQVNSIQGDFEGGDPVLTDYLANVPAGEDACEYSGINAAAQAACDDASSFGTMQAIFYPLAGVSAAVGVFLLATADWGGEGDPLEAMPVRIEPRIGTTGADVAVTVRF